MGALPHACKMNRRDVHSWKYRKRSDDPYTRSSRGNRTSRVRDEDEEPRRKKQRRIFWGKIYASHNRPSAKRL